MTGFEYQCPECEGKFNEFDDDGGCPFCGAFADDDDDVQQPLFPNLPDFEPLPSPYPDVDPVPTPKKPEPTNPPYEPNFWCVTLENGNSVVVDQSEDSSLDSPKGDALTPYFRA